jgi:hypothetical protein
MSVTLLGHVELADGNIDRPQALLEQSVVLHDAEDVPEAVELQAIRD